MQGVLSKDTKEIAIKNYLKHSIIKGGKPVEDLLKKEIAMVKDKTLVRWVFDGLSVETFLNETVIKIIKENVNNNVNENVNENDNDNDVSYYDSYHDSSKDRVFKRFTPPTLEQVSNYIERMGYSVDAERFVNYYGSIDWKVGKNKMKDWKKAVATWQTKEKSKKGKVVDF